MSLLLKPEWTIEWIIPQRRANLVHTDNTDYFLGLDKQFSIVAAEAKLLSALYKLFY